MIEAALAATTLARAPVAASKPLQTRRLTISLSTYSKLPRGGAGVNHLAVGAVGIGSPALEEPSVHSVGPVAVDGVKGAVASPRQGPDPDQVVPRRRLAQHLGVAHGNHVIVLR